MNIEKKLMQLRKIARDRGVYVMNKLFDDHVTGLITKERTLSCFICGDEVNITKEHVLPKWVFGSDSKYLFKMNVNHMSQSFIRATVPACQSCNSDLLNSVERYIQKTLSEVDLKNSFYAPKQWETIIRWLEIIDFKSQVLDASSKFVMHKKAWYIPDLADFSLAFIREMSIRAVTSKARLALKRISRKDKSTKFNSLIVGRTIEKTFHYFHKSGDFIY